MEGMHAGAHMGLHIRKAITSAVFNHVRALLAGKSERECGVTDGGDVSTQSTLMTDIVHKAYR